MEADRKATAIALELLDGNHRVIAACDAALRAIGDDRERRALQGHREEHENQARELRMWLRRQGVEPGDDAASARSDAGNAPADALVAVERALVEAYDDALRSGALPHDLVEIVRGRLAAERRHAAGETQATSPEPRARD